MQRKRSRKQVPRLCSGWQLKAKSDKRKKLRDGEARRGVVWFSLGFCCLAFLFGFFLFWALCLTRVIPTERSDEGPAVRPSWVGYFCGWLSCRDRSFQVGLVRSMSATFFSRRHPLISFSRAIAWTGSSYCSKWTRRWMRYCEVKPGSFPSRCSARRRARLFVMPVEGAGAAGKNVDAEGAGHDGSTRG